MCFLLLIPCRSNAEMASANENEGLKAFSVVGLLFPLHILLGVFSVPALCYALYQGTTAAWVFLGMYMPFFLWPAQTRYPGWKGMDSMWDLFDYTRTCAAYFGKFDVIASAPICLLYTSPSPRDS